MLNKIKKILIVTLLIFLSTVFVYFVFIYSAIPTRLEYTRERVLSDLGLDEYSLQDSVYEDFGFFFLNPSALWSIKASNDYNRNRIPDGFFVFDRHDSSNFVRGLELNNIPIDGNFFIFGAEYPLGSESICPNVDCNISVATDGDILYLEIIAQ